MAKNKPNKNTVMEEPIVEKIVKKGMVTVELLNCRMGPSTDKNLCEFGPLKKGEMVEILNEENGWIEASTPYGVCYLLGEHITIVD